jgi:hypothetical protein
MIVYDVNLEARADIYADDRAGFAAHIGEAPDAHGFGGFALS